MWLQLDGNGAIFMVWSNQEDDKCRRNIIAHSLNSIHFQEIVLMDEITLIGTHSFMQYLQ